VFALFICFEETRARTCIRVAHHTRRAPLFGQTPTNVSTRLRADTPACQEALLLHKKDFPMLGMSGTGLPDASRSFVVKWLYRPSRRRIPMARTNVPTLRALAHTMSVYVTRYQATLQTHLTAPQIVALLAFIQCLDDLINALGEAPTED
jgi:hypothetical protein